MFAGITLYYRQFSESSQINQITLCKHLYADTK